MQKKLFSVANKLKVWIKRNNAADIVLFGSAIRGKTAPKDIDLCIIIPDAEEEKSIDLVASLGKLSESEGLKAHISILTASSFAKGDSLAKTLLNEGYSIAKRKQFSETFGFENKSIFTYTLRHFSPSRRVQFHYLLKGRYGSKGILAELEGKFLSSGAIIVQTSREDLLKEIFDRWKVKYEVKRVLVS